MRRFIPIILLLALAGCRETEPPPTHFEDLGTDGTPLLPTAPVWKNAAIANGQADWRAFREPASEPEVGDNDESKSDSESTGTAETGVEDEIRDEIRELISEFNEVTLTGTSDEVLDYFVAEQTDALKPIIETTLATREVLRQLKDAFHAKLPDAADRTEKAISAILADMSLELKGETLDVKSDTEVNVSVNGGVISKAYRFVIVDDQWFIKVSDVKTLGELTKSLDKGLQYYREMLESIGSGTVPAEDRLKELESAVAAAHASAPSGDEDGAGPDKEPVTDDGTGD